MTARLAFFALASAVLHGALLLAASAPAAWFGGHPVTVLSVSLTVADDHSRPARARLAPWRRRAPDPAGTAAAAVPATGRAAGSAALASRGHSSSPPPPAQAAAAAPSDGHTMQEQEARARIQARLHALLDRYFEYPYAARLRGWQGEVWLRLRVLADGRLDDLRVTRSSGFAVLDRSALHSLARVGRLEEAVEWLAGRSLDMQIAVVYRLREGS